MIQATLPRRAAPAFDLTSLDLNKLARQALQPWSDAYESWRSGVTDLVKPMTSAKDCCGCPTCKSDPCSCRCCVADADLVIEARLGERRIIPVTIENHWRRERDIELELSSWTRADGVQIKADILTETTFKLAPCGEAHVVIGVTVGAVNDDQAEGAAGANIAVNADRTATNPNRKLPDVDRCEVSYADLRIKGCDLRSIRIAVAVLPRDCEAYAVDCDCCCC